MRTTTDTETIKARDLRNDDILAHNEPYNGNTIGEIDKLEFHYYNGMGIDTACVWYTCNGISDYTAIACNADVNIITRNHTRGGLVAPKKGENKMTRENTVDIWNAATNSWVFVTADDLADNGKWDYITGLMDDEIRERVNDELAPCSRLEFLRRYTDIAGDDAVAAIYCY